MTLSSGLATVANVNLGASTASYMNLNGGTLIATGIGTVDFSIGTNAGPTQQALFTLSSGTLQFGTPGT